MKGPFKVVGDCVIEAERMAFAYIEYETLHNGDLGIWYMPSLEEGEQYAAKWLITDSAGVHWLACKYYAVRYREDFHIPIARIVCMICGESGSLDPALSKRMTSQIRSLRALPPKRDDLVVFARDLLQHEKIVAAIDEHRRHWAS